MFYENLPWFIALWICVLVVRQFWHATHQPVPASVSSPKRKAPRPLKPRTPNDCPVCGRPHPTPLWGNVRKPDVRPWSECKSSRGTLRAKTICTAGYACLNPDCECHGNTAPTFHALVGDGKRGADGIQWLRCQACHHRFPRTPKTGMARTAAHAGAPKARPERKRREAAPL